MKKLPTGLIYVSRDHLVYLNSALNQLLTFPYPDDSIKDLEVKHEEELEAGLKQFVEQNKISPGEIYVIFGKDTTFEKEGNDETWLKMVPFYRVRQRIYKLDKNSKMVAVNKELYEVWESLLMKLGFGVRAMTPATVLGLEQEINLAQGKGLLKNLGGIKQNSFDQEEREAANAEVEKSSDPRKNKKLMAMLLVLSLAILVLIAMMVINRKPTAKVAETVPEIKTVVSPPPVAPPVATSAGTLKAEEIRIQVVNSSGVSGEANKVKDQLVQAGFKQVETANGSKVSSEKSLVLFSASVSAEVRAKIVSQVEKILPVITQKDGLDSPNFQTIITINATLDKGEKSGVN